MPNALKRLILPGVVLLLTACSAAIIPPHPVQEPVTVYVLDHGRHSSLVLPTDGGGVRYSYGDWDYYVLRKTGFWNALYALLHPSPAALGRQLLHQPPSADNLQRQLRVGIVEILPIAVPATEAAALYEALENQFAAALDSRHYNEAFDVEFVTYPLPYTLRRNSNRKVGDWLEQLGCEIQGTPILSRWRLVEPSR